MTNAELTACLLYLCPGAAFGTSGTDLAKTEWKDPRPMPTQAEVDAALPLVQAQQAADAQAKATAATNEQTIGGALDAALQSNQLAISQLNTWLAANTGTLTTAQLSAAMRTAANNQVAQFRQLNGLVRLVRRNLSTADLSSALKG